MAFTPPNPGRSAAALPITAAFLVPVVSARFERDHIVGHDGQPQYLTVLPAERQPSGYETQPRRWGWTHAPPGYVLTIDIFRALHVGVPDRGTGGIILREAVTDDSGATAPRESRARLLLAEDGRTVLLEVEGLISAPPSVPAVSEVPAPAKVKPAKPAVAPAAPTSDADAFTPPNPG